MDTPSFYSLCIDMYTGYFQRPLIFSGHRSGRIAVWDHRQQMKVFCMQENKLKGVPSSIIGVHPLLDDNYFVSSAFNSKVNLEIILHMRCIMYRA